MNDIKLIKLLKTFSKQEVRRFRDFVKSPYFNKNTNVIKLAEIILEHHPEYDSTLLEEKNLFKELFKNKKYNYHNFKNLISDIYSLCFEFLKQHRGFFTDFSPEMNLMTQLIERKQFELYQKTFKNLDKKTHLNPVTDQMTLYRKYLLAVTSHIYYTDTSHLSKKRNETPLKKMQELHDYFFEYSLLTLLRQYNRMKQSNIENSFKYNMKLFDKILDFLKEEDSFSSVTTLTYKYITLLNEYLDEKYYYELKRIYTTRLNELNKYDADTAYFYLQDYCATMFSRIADKKYLHERYTLLKYAFENNSEFVTGFHYNNYLAYIRIFCGNNDVNTARKFIEKWKDNIPPEQAGNCDNYTNALLEYAGNNSERALNYISKVKISTAIEGLHVKIFHLRLLIESGNKEQSRAQIESLKQYLLKNKMISPVYKIPLTQFAGTCLKLISAEEINGKRRRKEALILLYKKASILEGNYFGTKIWILEQLRFRVNRL